MGYLAKALRTAGRTIWPTQTTMFSFYGRLAGERDYHGLVGDGSGSALAGACIRWIANAFTETMPAVQSVDPDDEATGTIVQRHACADLVRRPTFDPDLGQSSYSGHVFMAAMLASFIVDGNAYALKLRGAGGAGRPVQLWYAPHSIMEPKRGADGYIDHYDYSPKPGMQPEPWPVRDVIHMRDGIDPRNTMKGLSRLKGVLRELYTDEEAARWTAALLYNYGIPGLVVSPKSGAVSEDDAREVKNRLMTQFTGDRRGEPVVLKGPTDVSPFGFSPDQMKLGDIRDIPEERVSAAVGVPAAVVGFGAGLQSTKVGATMAELVDLAWQNGALPPMRTFAAEFTEQLLPDFEGDAGRGHRFIFDIRHVPIMADYRLKQAQTYEVLGRWSMVTREDARKSMGLPIGPRDRVYMLSSGVVEVDATKPLAVPPPPEPTPTPTPEPTPTPTPGADGPAAKDLSQRERDVARRIAIGDTNKAIAAALGVSERQVERIVSQAMTKARVASRAGLAAAV